MLRGNVELAYAASGVLWQLSASESEVVSFDDRDARAELSLV